MNYKMAGTPCPKKVHAAERLKLWKHEKFTTDLVAGCGRHVHGTNTPFEALSRYCLTKRH